MKTSTRGAGLRAAATAALLLVTGAVIGVTADRLWLSPPEAFATPLTAEAMAAELGLSETEEVDLRSVLDSLHGEILAAVEQDPGALPAAVRSAQLRIEAGLPPHARAGFRTWMQQHHERHEQWMHGRGHEPMDHGPLHEGAPGGEPPPAGGGAMMLRSQSGSGIPPARSGRRRR